MSHDHDTIDIVTGIRSPAASVRHDVIECDNLHGRQRYRHARGDHRTIQRNKDA